MQQKRISLTVFRINLHLLTHIGEMIREQGVLRAYSCRSVERSIKTMKNKMNAVRFAGENASNIVEIDNMLSFIDIMGFVDFGRASKPVDDSTFENHPDSRHAEQLWSPFHQETFTIFKPAKKIDGLFSFGDLGKALFHYFARIGGLRLSQFRFSPEQLHYPVRFSSRLWLDNITYHSQLYKSKRKTITKEGYYVMFKYGNRIYQNK